MHLTPQQPITNVFHWCTVSAQSILVYYSRTFPINPLWWNSTDANKSSFTLLKCLLQKISVTHTSPLEQKTGSPYTKNSWSLSTLAQTPFLATDCGSTSIETVRWKVRWLGPQTEWLETHSNNCSQASEYHSHMHEKMGNTGKESSRGNLRWPPKGTWM